MVWAGSPDCGITCSAKHCQVDPVVGRARTAPTLDDSFLFAVGKKTDVFVRFSTVGSEKGSADAARGPRGFAGGGGSRF